MSRRRNRPQRNLRGPAVVDARKRILVVCEGEVTEPAYLRAFSNARRNSGVEVAIHGPGGDPVTLVDKATELRGVARTRADAEHDENVAYDETWCCFDVDAFGPRVQTARDTARARGLRLAMSNPCFELWLLLHFRDNPGPQDRHAMQRRYRDEQPLVDDKHIDFEILAPRYEDAYQRAKRLHEAASRDGQPNRNATTEVYLLTDAIDAEGRERRRRAERQRRDSGRAQATAAEEAAWAQARQEGWQDPPGDEGGDA